MPLNWFGRPVPAVTEHRYCFDNAVGGWCRPMVKPSAAGGRSNPRPPLSTEVRREPLPAAAAARQLFPTVVALPRARRAAPGRGGDDRDGREEAVPVDRHVQRR